MDITGFLTDEDAASSVIGVVLMVAVAVILAAVIGQFVLGLGDKVNNNAPQAKFDFTTESFVTEDNGGDRSNLTRVRATHAEGDVVTGEEIEMRVNGKTAFDVAEIVGGGNDPVYARTVPDETRRYSAGDNISVSMVYSGNLTINESVIVGFNGTTGDVDYWAYDTDGPPFTGGGGELSPKFSEVDKTKRIDSGDEVEIFWTDPESDDSAKLADYEVP